MQLFSSATDSDFLFLYAALLAAAGALAWWIPVQWRDVGRRGEVPDAESAAFLAGGAARLADAVLADLYARGGIEAAGGQRLARTQHSPSVSPAGRAVLALDEPLTLQTVRRTIAPHAERLAARLRRTGLLMWPEDHLRLRWLSVAPFAALLLLGLYRLRLASTEGQPTGVLIALLALTALLAVLRFFISDPRTRAGLEALAALRARHGRSLARGEDVPMAVALHGTAVLAGTPWEALHTLRQAGETGSSGDGGSSEQGLGGDAGCDAGGGDGGGCGD